MRDNRKIRERLEMKEEGNTCQRLKSDDWNSANCLFVQSLTKRT